MKVSVVEINGSYYRYGYDPDNQGTRYLGPVGDVPTLSEEEFLSLFSDRPGEFKGSIRPSGFAMTKEQKKRRGQILRKMEEQMRRESVNFKDLNLFEQDILVDSYKEWKHQNRIPTAVESLELWRLQEMDIIEIHAVSLAELGAEGASLYEISFTKKGEKMMEMELTPGAKFLEGVEFSRHHEDGCKKKKKE